ncbi:MAG: serine/threonine protein kinase [Deltaproteobacteria bacterium]|nr:serine/threonine protein kinase [Deltaproteobacteria bacterium]
MIGTVIEGKYRLLRRVGAGGFAEVYEAVHDQIGQRLAVKVMHKELAHDPAVTSTFLHEARVAAATGHGSVVQVFDVGTLGTGEPFIVMEFLEGEPLSERLDRQRRLGVEETVDIGVQLLFALDAVHRAGVVHRDIKPENVFLESRPGQARWVKVIDFGVARLLSEGANAAKSPAGEVVMGTPFYASPEQIRGNRLIDGRADIYAVGVMMFEMLAGDVPFRGGTAQDVFAAALTQPYPALRALRPDVSDELEDVLRQATARNRDGRFATAAEFAVALRALGPHVFSVRVSHADMAMFAPAEVAGPAGVPAGVQAHLRVTPGPDDTVEAAVAMEAECLWEVRDGPPAVTVVFQGPGAFTERYRAAAGLSLTITGLRPGASLAGGALGATDDPEPRER